MLIYEYTINISRSVQWWRLRTVWFGENGSGWSSTWVTPLFILWMFTWMPWEQESASGEKSHCTNKHYQIYSRDWFLKMGEKKTGTGTERIERKRYDKKQQQNGKEGDKKWERVRNGKERERCEWSLVYHLPQYVESNDAVSALIKKERLEKTISPLHSSHNPGLFSICLRGDDTFHLIFVRQCWRRRHAPQVVQHPWLPSFQPAGTSCWGSSSALSPRWDPNPGEYLTPQSGTFHSSRPLDVLKWEVVSMSFADKHQGPWFRVSWQDIILLKSLFKWGWAVCFTMMSLDGFQVSELCGRKHKRWWSWKETDCIFLGWRQN